MGFRVATAGNSLGDGITTRLYDEDGVLEWSVGNNANAIGIGSGDGIIATTSDNADNDGIPVDTTRAYDNFGDLLWTADHGAFVNDADVGPSGQVATGGNRTSEITTRLYDSAGDLQWSVDHGDFVRSVAVGPDGEVATGGNRTSEITTRLYNSAGALQWSVDHGATVQGVSIINVDFLNAAPITTGAPTVEEIELGEIPLIDVAGITTGAPVVSPTVIGDPTTDAMIAADLILSPYIMPNIKLLPFTQFTVCVTGTWRSCNKLFPFTQLTVCVTGTWRSCNGN